jgi:hypothetical protein
LAILKFSTNLAGARPGMRDHREQRGEAMIEGVTTDGAASLALSHNETARQRICHHGFPKANRADGPRD